MYYEHKLIIVSVVRASIPRTERPFMKNEKRKKMPDRAYGLDKR